MRTLTGTNTISPCPIPRMTITKTGTSSKWVSIPTWVATRTIAKEEKVCVKKKKMVSAIFVLMKKSVTKNE